MFITQPTRLTRAWFSQRRHGSTNTLAAVSRDLSKWKYPLPDLPALPPLSQWKKTFAHHRSLKGRNVIADFPTALSLADAFIPNGSKNVTVVEAYPGPGVLTRALLSLPKDRIGKVIALEDFADYRKSLETLAAVDSRLEVLSYPSMQWNAYEQIESRGILPPPQEWSNVHSSLHFISNFPTDAHGQQFLAQIFRCIPERLWLFKQGRINVHCILDTKSWKRAFSPLGSKVRHKVAAVTDLTASCELSLPLPSSSSHPIFFTRSASPLTDAVAATFVPLEHQVIAKGDMTLWDYVMRRLYATANAPLRKSLQQVAVGATSLLPELTDPSRPANERVDPEKKTKDLSPSEITAIVHAFKKWPFAPTDLSVDDPFSDGDTTKW